MHDRILITVGDSPVSGRALEEATKPAGPNGGRLRVITIVDNPLYHPPDYAMYYNPEPLREAVLKAADDALAKARGKAEANNAEGATFDRVCQERTSEEIAERIEFEAQANDTDVVVMGIHGRRGMRRLTLGNVAEGLIHVASRPVLLVHDK